MGTLIGEGKGGGKKGNERGGMEGVSGEGNERRRREGDAKKNAAAEAGGASFARF